jgi:sulfonate transport system permease protein
VPLALLGLWQAASTQGWVAELVLPSPWQVLLAFRGLVTSGALANGLAVSLQRLAYGYTIGAAIGLALGTLLAMSGLARRLIAPSFYAIARVPLLAWIPLFMMLFGIGEAMKLAVIAKAALTPVTINTERAMRAVPAAWLELGRLYRLDGLTRLRLILLPATALPVFVGLRLGLVQGWAALVAIELLASARGLGFQLTMARQLFRLDKMMALMLVIGVIGFALDAVLAALERRVARRLGGAA